MISFNSLYNVLIEGNNSQINHPPAWEHPNYAPWDPVDCWLYHRWEFFNYVNSRLNKWKILEQDIAVANNQLKNIEVGDDGILTQNGTKEKARLDALINTKKLKMQQISIEIGKKRKEFDAIKDSDKINADNYINSGYDVSAMTDEQQEVQRNFNANANNTQKTITNTINQRPTRFEQMRINNAKKNRTKK